MARRKSYGKARSRRWYGRSFMGTQAGYARGRYGGRIGFGGRNFGVSLTMPFLLGAAVGMTDLDKMIPAPIKILAAAAPVRGIGPIKGFAQGLLIGDVVQALTGFTLPVPGISGSSTSGNGGTLWG